MLLASVERRGNPQWCCCCAVVQIIARLGEAINHPDSVYYWAWKNNIPVFCPAITDGSIGETAACAHLRLQLDVGAQWTGSGHGRLQEDTQCVCMCMVAQCGARCEEQGDAPLRHAEMAAVLVGTDAARVVDHLDWLSVTCMLCLCWRQHAKGCAS